jgi:hypothetical protein
VFGASIIYVFPRRGPTRSVTAGDTVTLALLHSSAVVGRAMRRTMWFLCAMGAALVGCVSQPTLWSSLDGFVRQHVSVAIRWLGEPTAQRVLAGDAINHLYQSPLWVPPGRGIEFPKFGNGTFYAWSSTGDGSGCLINLYADTNGIVTGRAWSGDSQQCAHYADVLNHAPHRRQSFCGEVRAGPCIE